MSSCLPSAISLKLRMVSASFTYIPLKPVNCSATWNGCERYLWIFRARDEDKLSVSRARKIQRFLSQPFHVAEQFTGFKGMYVKLADTIRSFKEIADGKHDDIPEQAFYMQGTIDDVLARAEAMKAAA